MSKYRRRVRRLKKKLKKKLRPEKIAKRSSRDVLGPIPPTTVMPDKKKYSRRRKHKKDWRHDELRSSN